ncbi:MAG: putative A/G-specific adenine glycosylase YfhQ [Chloroflexi bacterium ADurb.Bin325]|nr:MAG: putative A/G-specific adenine glycosylase YfhQ [Chloroflexi bacterium ADurb.Bin325]
MIPDCPDVSHTVAALLHWMASARRDLPWRQRRDPYAVWVSEVMLQQTQAATVVPYFERWLTRFPDVETLAAAPLDAVLKAWEGLGYYARGRNLHRAAQLIVARHGGQLPRDRAALRALPGIGRYTAGAILSLAYGQPEPALDGNVRRVLCRLCDVAEDPRQPAVEARLWEVAGALAAAAPPGRAGDLNEALMELGALVCTPGVPACDACPLAEQCRARRRGVQAERPVRAARPSTPHYDMTAAVIADTSGRLLIVRRPDAGLLGGLWGFPGGAAQPDEPLPAAVERNVREQVGVAVAAGARLARVKHAYTHFRITLHAFACAWTGGAPACATCADARWVAAGELADYAFPATDRKIAEQIA